jgi:protein phosphatase
LGNHSAKQISLRYNNNMNTHFHFHTVALTDPGCQDKLNEDNILCTEANGSGPTLLAIADGMGGHLAGEFASQMVIDALQESLQNYQERATSSGLGAGSDTSEHLIFLLKQAVQKANKQIHDYAQTELEGAPMGSTLTCALIHNNYAFIANVGDSRTYLWREGQLRQLTQDHSLVEVFVRETIITHNERYEHPARNVVTRAVGPDEQVDADIFVHRLQAGDCLLLCSDGLSDMLHGSKGMMPYLQAEGDLEVIGRNLIEAAKEAGGYDNISLILAEVVTS